MYYIEMMSPSHVAGPPSLPKELGLQSVIAGKISSLAS